MRLTTAHGRGLGQREMEATREEQPESCHSQNATSVNGPMDIRARQSRCPRGEARLPLAQTVVNIEPAGTSGDVRQKKFLLKSDANFRERHHWRIGAVLSSRGDNRRQPC